MFMNTKTKTSFSNISILFIFMLCLSFLLNSCNSTQKKLKNNAIQLEHKLVIDSINLNEYSDGIGGNSFQILTENDSVFVFFLPKNPNALTIIHYVPGNPQFYKNIAIPTQYKNLLFSEFQGIEQFLPINRDSIIFIQKNLNDDFLVSLFDVKNNTIDNITKTLSANSIFLFLDKVFLYDKDSQSIFISIIRHDDFEKRTHTMDTEFIAKIHIPSKNFEILDFKYPLEYENLYLYGQSWGFNACVVDENIAVSFPLITDIFLYNIMKKENIRLQMKTPFESEFLLYSEEEIIKNKELLEDSYKRSFYYTGLKWDTFKRFFYRFYELELTEKDTTGSFSVYADKKIGVAVFSYDYSYIGDIDLGQIRNIPYNRHNITPTPYGLLSVEDSKADSNTPKFHLIVLEDE